MIVLGPKGEEDKELLNATIREISASDATIIAQVQAKNQPEYERVVKENSILESLVPKNLTAEAIGAVLANSNTEIRNAKSDGQATGIAMQALKAAGLSIDGKVVSEVVKGMRSKE